MRFLIDAQLPVVLARWIESRGFSADHVFEIGLACAADSEIWKRALDTSAVIVTKDEDFALRRQLAPIGAPAVVWIRLGNSKTRSMLTKMAAAWNDVVASLERGEMLIEVA